MPAARYWSFIASATTMKCVVAPGRVFLRSAKNEIAGCVLKIAERRAVDGVDDDGHPGAPGGEPAKDSRLAAVRVDDVRPLGAQNFFKLPQCEPILQRMDGPDEFGNDDKAWSSAFRRQAAGNRLKAGLQTAFRANGRAGDQTDFDGAGTRGRAARAPLAQAENGGDGIFLRAADDEPRDDVNDTHRADSMIYFFNSRNRSRTVWASPVLVAALAR